MGVSAYGLRKTRSGTHSPALCVHNVFDATADTHTLVRSFVRPVRANATRHREAKNLQKYTALSAHWQVGCVASVYGCPKSLPLVILYTLSCAQARGTTTSRFDTSGGKDGLNGRVSSTKTQDNRCFTGRTQTSAKKNFRKVRRTQSE